MTIYFRKQTSSWYAEFAKGKPINLKVKGDPACCKTGNCKHRDAAIAAAALEQAKQPAEPAQVSPAKPDADPLVVELIDGFLDWVKPPRRAARTLEWYEGHCNSLKKWIVKHFNGRLTISKLTAQHIEDWIDESYANSGKNHKNGAARAASRVFNWARKRKHISANPIAEWDDRPKAEPRKNAYIPPEDWRKLIAAIPAGPFLDILRFLKLTGCRPNEACIAEVRHFDRANRCLVFEVEESKGKQFQRVVQLGSGEAFEIVSRLVADRKDGFIFRTCRGNQWSSDSLNTCCDKYETKTGVKVTPYKVRHSFITDALVAGTDPITLANMVGHRDLKMIMGVYAHLNLKGKHLADTLDKINRAVA